MSDERLHKVMARAGIASRRACEKIIAAGRVEVNGQVVTEMGVKVDPQRDQIRVDGELLQVRRPAGHIYRMLYKPAGYLSVFEDERNRPGLEALIQVERRLFPVGRLDLESEGLMLLTNDGEVAQRLSHPRYGHRKVYLVQVNRRPGSDVLARLRRGIELEDGKTAPARWTVLEKPPAVHPAGEVDVTAGAWLRVTLGEGRKRQIRRMAAAQNLKVLRLIRIRLGPLALDRNLKPGESRPLKQEEIRLLRHAAPGPSRRGRHPRGGAAGRARRRRPDRKPRRR